MKNLTVLFLAGLVLLSPAAALAQTSSGSSGSSVCSISDSLMKNYDKLILELREAESDKEAEEITRKVTALKQEIEKQRMECANAGSATNAAEPVSKIAPQVMIDKPVVVPPANRCGEVAQWETKIAYYRKLAGMSDADLKNEGFSRADIERTLDELMSGAEKVRAQCSVQSNTQSSGGSGGVIAPPTETVKPVVLESGQEISSYYKERLEKVTSADTDETPAEEQIEELKALRDEIDDLIAKLIKGKKELEGSELGALVTEVRVSKGEIKADNVSIETTGKKILTNIGVSSVSVEPTENRVLIRDKGLEVTANEITIKENKISVGGTEVKLPASFVAEKLNLTPKSIELKEENEKAVYNIKVDEPRKLFGLIQLNIEKTVTADAGNGDELGQSLPWYAFLTTK